MRNLSLAIAIDNSYNLCESQSQNIKITFLWIKHLPGFEQWIFFLFIAIDGEEDANDSIELWEVRDECLLSSAECDGIMRDCENLFISTAACSASSQSIHIDPFQITSFPVNECTDVVQVNWLASESSNEKKT
jgi:hypothetical protein